MSDYDPDVAAAFGVGSAPAAQPSPAPAYDPDVAGAFNTGAANQLKAPDPYISRETDQPIASETPIGEAVNAYNRWWGGKLASGAQAVGVTDPKSLGYVRNLPAAAETVLGSYRPSGLPQASPFARGIATATEHPLAAAARSVQGDVDTLNQQASAAGFGDIGNRQPPGPTQLVNHLARKDLGLPTLSDDGVQAPLYPDMLHAGNKQYVSPAFQAVEQYQKQIPISDATKATFDDVKRMLSPGEAKALPTGDTMTSAQGLQLSQTLRARAQQIPDSGMNPTTNEMWSTIGKAHMDAAKAIEGDMRTQFTNDGQGQLADNWHDAVVYRAKSGAYEDALDGAGNVLAPVLKKQLLKQGIPLTDNAKLIAHVAAQAPEQFRGAPQAPQPGLIRSTISKAAPALGAVAGAASPLGPLFGSAAGAALGEKVSDWVTKP